MLNSTFSALSFFDFLVNILAIIHSWQFYTLFILEAFDFITGTIIAIKNHQLNSSISFYGISRKMLTLSFVIVFGALLKSAPDNVEYLAIGLIFAFIIPVLYSVVENFAILGMPLPDIITKYFEKLNK